MSNLNKVHLIGRLGRDPELRYTKTGQAVCNFSIATSENWKDKQGNKQESTEWHNIVAWAGQAEFAGNYLRKGRLVYIEGRLQTRDWVDNANVKHYRTEVVANNVQGLDRADASQGGARPQEQPYSGQQDAPPTGGQSGAPQQQGGQAGAPQIGRAHV